MLPTLGGISEDTNTLQTSDLLYYNIAQPSKTIYDSFGYNLGTAGFE